MVIQDITILIWLHVDQEVDDDQAVSGQRAPRKYSDQTVSNIWTVYLQQQDHLKCNQEFEKPHSL